MLLLRIKGRSLAALGAAITLFALAMDPFFQQVVGFPEQWRKQLLAGSIPRATAYTTYTAGTFSVETTPMVELDQAISATAYLYFYDNGTMPIVSSDGIGIAPPIPLACPSSKCTWAEYESLSVCNRCTDIRDRLEYRCLNTTLDWIQDPVALPDGSNWDYPNGTACGWYLIADKPILMTGYTTDQFTNYTGEVLVSRSQPLYDIFTRDPIPGYEAKLNDTRNPMSHFVVVSGNNVTEVRNNATPIAHECILSVSHPQSRGRAHLQTPISNLQSLEWFLIICYSNQCVHRPINSRNDANSMTYCVVVRQDHAVKHRCRSLYRECYAYGIQQNTRWESMEYVCHHGRRPNSGL